MAADCFHTDWPSSVVRFISDNIEYAGAETEEAGIYMHDFTSAAQMGCVALAALGQADLAEAGFAIARAEPRLPEILPRWDDLCVVVLTLAAQRNRIYYYSPDEAVEFTAEGSAVTDPASGVPSLNIAGTEGLGFARADAETLLVLTALGLVSDGKWTRDAETVLWREHPDEWDVNFEDDPRFAAAVDQASNMLPEDIAVEIERLITITDADISLVVTEKLKFIEEMTKSDASRTAAQNLDFEDEQSRMAYEKWQEGNRKFRELAYSLPTPEQVRRSVEFYRLHDLDWLFFRRWRLGEGWLTPEASKRALGVFHDPLAISMRHAVITRLYPSVRFLASRF